MSKQVLMSWLLEALEASPGQSGTIANVAREIYRRHEADLREMGDLFFTWQYDLRWAAHRLRARGLIEDKKQNGRAIWALRSDLSKL